MALYTLAGGFPFQAQFSFLCQVCARAVDDRERSPELPGVRHGQQRHQGQITAEGASVQEAAAQEISG